MKAETFKQTTEVLGNPKIMISIGIIVLIVGIIIAIFWKKIKNAIDDAKQKRDYEQKVDEIENFTQKKPSYPDSYYATFADQLYAAMDGWGTDEESIYNVMYKIKNDVDYMKLVEAFGVRDSESLSEWISGDCNTKEINEINSILKNNGVSMGF